MGCDTDIGTIVCVGYGQYAAESFACWWCGLFAGYPQRPKPLNSVGLKECGEFLRGEIKTQAGLEELVCTHTAQLAKRQRTFNRSQFESKFSGSVKECEEKIIEFLKG